MKKLSTTQQRLLTALALAALGTAITAPAFAGSWGAGPSSRNIRPYVQGSTNDSGLRAYATISADSGYSAYAMVASDYTNNYNTVPTSLGHADRFGVGSQS